MSKDTPRIILIALISVLATLWFFFPSSIGSSNKSLEAFVAGPFLSVLGFVISVTLASCSNIFMKLKELENRGMGPFQGTITRLKRSCYSLIILFAVGFVFLVIKGSHQFGEQGDALFNGIFILVMYFFIAVLFDITRTTFKLP